MLIALNQIELLYFEVELPSSAQPTSFFNFIVLSVLERLKNFDHPTSLYFL